MASFKISKKTCSKVSRIKNAGTKPCKASLGGGGSLREALHAAYMGEYLDLRYRKCLAICSFVLVNTFSPVEGGIFVWFSFEKNTAQKIPRTQNSNISSDLI